MLVYRVYVCMINYTLKQSMVAVEIPYNQIELENLAAVKWGPKPAEALCECWPSVRGLGLLPPL